MADAIPGPTKNLLVSTDGSEWHPPASAGWRQESLLRDLLAKHPTLIPGVDDPGAVAVTELHIPGMGSLDVACVEPDGSITLCEVKLQRNPEIRRAVVGQLLAYGAGLSAMSFEDLDRAWAARSDAGAQLADQLVPDNDDLEGRQDLQREIGSRLAAGRFRLVFAVDELTDELKAVVAFLADRTTDDLAVLALEVGYARQGETQMLLTSAFGSELTSTKRRASRGTATGIELPVEQSQHIIAAACDISATAGHVARQLLSELKPHISYLYLRDKASISPILVATEPVRCQPVRISLDQEVPGVRVCFSWMRGLGDDRLELLLTRLQHHEALAPHLGDVRPADFRKRPSLPFEGCLDQPGAVETLISGLREALSPFP